MVRIVSLAAALLGVGLVGGLVAELARLRMAGPGPEVVPRPPGGSLVICGGGRLPEAIRDRFFALAGGRQARIVVIPTANPLLDDEGTERGLAIWRGRGAASVVALHTLSRAEADDPAFARPLGEATGVWIGGGNQSWLTGAYAGTEVERQLKRLLDRGGVIGGSSAGAAVMTRTTILGGGAEATLGRGFDFLPGAVVDQHFLRRNRARRLLGVVAGHPDLVGFGIDEGTALLVDVRGRRLRVLGDSYVMTCIPDPAGGPARIEILKRGDETSLDALREPDGIIASAIPFDEFAEADR